MKLLKVGVFLFGVALSLPGALFSCSDSDTISLSREDLFTLNLGKMENQFDYFFNAHTTASVRNDVFSDGGVFFIVNGNADKVMQFSPLGDLTLLLYNPARNPLPVLLKTGDPKADGYDIISRRAVPVAFSAIGACGVDGPKNIYIEDRAPTPGGPDVDAGPVASTPYREVIKRFDRLGNYLDTIGRTGKNGLPFPAIEDFYLTNKNQLVVVCPVAGGTTVYWLDDRSTLLYEVQFDYLRLPAPKDADIIPTLGKIVPDYNARQLYVMISYFAYLKDEATRLVSRVNHVESRIYTYDLEKEKYDPNYIAIPAELGQTNDPLFSQDKQKTPLPYTFLGVSETNRFFLMKNRNTTTYELAVLDPAGRTQKKIRLFLDDTGMVSAAFHITKGGLLYALIAEDTCARVVRWRSDEAVAGGL